MKRNAASGLFTESSRMIMGVDLDVIECQIGRADGACPAPHPQFESDPDFRLLHDRGKFSLPTADSPALRKEGQILQEKAYLIDGEIDPDRPGRGDDSTPVRISAEKGRF